MSSAKIRRQGRSRALEYLFGLEFTHNDWRAGFPRFWEKHESRPQAREYAEKLVEGVCIHKDELDGHIREALTNWSWDRVDPVERSVLRIALYEMAYCGDVPPAVAINEAVEITHAYGGDESPRFVNGVLDKLKRVRVEQP